MYSSLQRSFLSVQCDNRFLTTNIFWQLYNTGFKDAAFYYVRFLKAAAPFITVGFWCKKRNDFHE